MLAFVFKSALCLATLFGFYHFFLRNINAFNFNRFYLLFSLIFAITIPFITIRINTYSNLQGFSNVTGILIKGEKIIAEPISVITFQELLIILYFIVSAILLLRFALNIYKIIKLIRTSPKVENFDNHIILIENKILPYSFFQYIFVYRSDYEKGIIKKELIIHEQVHCLEYHSVDILIIELVNIFLWFNPFLRLFRKAIQLNHEFLADNKVLSSCELGEYQNTLLNLVFRNNSTYLASNFNYSLTKKRLIMMAKINSNNKVVLRKIAVIPLFFILALTLSLTKDKLNKEQNREANDRKKLVFADERKAAAAEQTNSFQEGLTNERDAATKEQNASFQEKLADERKAAAEGTIVIGQKENSK